MKRHDDLFAALSVVVLLIGTATNSAMALMVMSAILLSMMVVFYRSRLRGGALMVASVAALTAIVIAFVLIFL
jgi:hypothetical protein